MGKDQLSLFPDTGFEVIKKGERYTISYLRDHTISFDAGDRLCLKYEIARLVMSGLATRQEAARRFSLHPDTVAKYCHTLSVAGLEGLRDHKASRLSRRSQAHVLNEIHVLVTRFPHKSVRHIHSLLANPGLVSFWTVKRLVHLFKRGMAPADLAKQTKNP